MCKQEPCSLLNEWIALLAKSTGDIVEWDASGLLHRIIERREGVLVDVYELVGPVCQKRF